MASIPNKVEQISDGNRILTKKELQYLETLSKHPRFLNNFDTQALKKLKKLLTKQLLRYKGKKGYLRYLTFKVKRYIRIRIREGKKYDDSKYESIYKLDKMKEAIKLGRLRVGKYKVTLKRLNSRKKRGITKVKMKYSGVRYDIVKIDDAIALYKDMIKAGEISVKVDEYAVKHAKNGKNIYRAGVTKAKQEYAKLSAKEKKGLAGVFAYARQFEGFGKYKGKKQLERLMWKGALEDFWCGRFVYGVFKHNGINLKNKVDNISTAGSYIGINLSGLHIGIADGKGNVIMGNTGGKVAYRYRGRRYIGWILPKYAGDITKVHWRHEGGIPPAGALVIPWARKDSLKPVMSILARRGGKMTKSQIYKLLGMRKHVPKRVRYRSKHYTAVKQYVAQPHKTHRRHRDPLEVLNSSFND